MDGQRADSVHIPHEAELQGGGAANAPLLRQASVLREEL